MMTTAAATSTTAETVTIFQGVVEMARCLAAERTLDGLFRKTVEVSSTLLDAERATLYLVDPATGELVSRLAQGTGAAEIRLAAGHGLAGHVAATGEAVCVADAYADPRFNARFDEQSGFRTRQVVAVPIVSPRGQRIGVLQAINARGRESFSPVDVELLRALATFASTPIEHARQVDQMQAERADLERRLQASEAARVESRSAIDTLAHELRTPLTSAIGYVDLLMDGEAGTVAPEQRQHLDIVKRNLDRLLGLTTDLLDAARLESGKLPLRREAVHLGDLAEMAAASLWPQIVRKQQQITVDVREPLPAVVGDAGRLAQVLTNLVSNAHKYTPRGGQIALTVAAEGDHLRVDVQDSGIGLSADDQQHLFTRFWRAQNDATRGIKGTGLGLAISKALVEMHGGSIRVQSEPGMGATFSVLLPRAIPADLAGAPGAPATLPARQSAPAAGGNAPRPALVAA